MIAPRNSETVGARRALPCTRWEKLWRDLAREQSGQTLVIAALCMVVPIAFLGLAIDVGQMRYHRRQLQMMADAAAIAGALELSSFRKTGKPQADRVKSVVYTPV